MILTDEQVLAYVTKGWVPDDVWTSKELFDYINQHYALDEVFSADALIRWAEAHGYKLVR